MGGRSGLHALALDELKEIVGDRLALSRSARDQHARDESPLPPAAPDAVAFPRSTSEVARIVQICSRWRIPVIPFGAGTSLEGHVLATSGGLSLDFSEMNEIVSINVADLDVTVQPGVTRKQLNETLRKQGLFFPVDPGADATLGGMAATGASGTTTVRYGAVRDNVLSLEVVLSDGRVIDTGRRARKSSAGYDLTRLFIGSEGTLGVITAITLRVYGVPEAISSATCHFPDLERAVQAVITTLQIGIPVARIELLDECAIAAVNAHSQLNLPVAPTLFLEFHGSGNSAPEQAEQFREVAGEFGVLGFHSTADHAERTTLFRARHDAFFASLALRPGARAITTDVCVPISRLAECIVEAKKDVDKIALPATIVGHVGDGNFHLIVMVDTNNEDEMRQAEEVNDRLVERALEMDGTSTGEHGIGLHKMRFLEKEFGKAVDVMRSIKISLDPLNIMNPGKVVPGPDAPSAQVSAAGGVRPSS